MSARFQSKAGALIGAAVMLLTLVPTVAVGDNAAGSPDGLVVVIHPRNAVYEDAGVLVASVQNAYVFDFQLFTAGGQPYHVSKYMVDVHTVDGRAQPPGSSPFDSTLVWTRTFDLGDSYASAGTLRIPANVLTVRAPDGHEVPFFGGLTVTILPMLDENRQSLLDADFHYPAGQFSLPANEAAAQGDYARADQLDEGFTPVFITHGQLSGLLQYGNPVVNPGFEFFVCDEDTARAATDGNADCSNRPAPNEADADGKMAVPPWFIRADVPDANGDKVPCSIHHINGSSPEGAAAMSIHYKPCDNGRRLLLGQIISEPGAPLHWEGAQDSTVSFSLRIAGSATPARIGVSVRYEVPGGAAHSFQGPFEYPSDAEYHRYTYDLQDAIAGKRILGIYFQFEDSPGPFVAQFDNVVIGGAQLPGDREERTDSTDGYAAFIDVLGDDSLTDAGEVSVSAVRLANNQAGYLFRISAMDYTGIAPQPVAVAQKSAVAFQLLDQEYATSGLDHETPVYAAALGGPDAARFFPVLDADGEPTGDLMFVVPGATAAGKVLVPWTWIDAQPGDAYEPVYSSDGAFRSEPVSGYYSPLRNSLRGYGLADSFDYSFAPVNFSATIAQTIAYPTTLTLACVNMSSTTRCGDDPSPVLTATLATASPYEEPLTVELVSAGTGAVLKTATVAAPGGVATFTLTAAEKDAIEETGNTTLFARSKPGFFAGSAVSGQLDLGNLAPVARIDHAPLEGLRKGSVVQFTSGASDPDGNPLTLQWKLELVGDATDDADDVPAGIVPGGTGTAGVFRPTIPDDGVYRVTLTATDTGGGVATASKEFAAANVAPGVTLTAPRHVRPGAGSVAIAAADPDGILADLQVDDGSGTLAAVPLGTTSFPVDFEEGVTYVFRAAATDDDGATGDLATLTVDVDGEAPTTTLTAPPAPASGWFTGPVGLAIARADAGGSGVQATQVVVDGVTTTFPGGADITQTVSGDGEHTVSVTTIDNAGNVGETVTRTIRIDASAPTVSITSPSATAYAPDAIPIGDVLFVPVYHGFQGSTITIRAAALDAHSGISKVEFYVDAGTPECVDTNGADGWSCTWNVGNDAAYHTITARAFNASGLDAVAAEQVYVLTVP